ncbi:MAG: hypothetical protein H0T84_09665 [Tatlockia sp.]|nr:hypothetical protein [Tatlockia sp.]
MAAFTYLCEKVNISLFNNTLTIYPKSREKKIVSAFHPVQGFITYEDEDSVKELDDVLNNDAELNEKIRYVKENHSDHSLYHQDNLDKEKTHYHLKFQNEIEEPQLNQILTFFAKYKLITAFEKENCLKTYRVVKNNLSLPSTNLQNIESKTVKSEEFSVKSNSYKQSVKTSGKLSLEDLRTRVYNLNSLNPTQQAFLDQLRIMTTKALQLKEKAQTKIDYGQAALSADNLCRSLFDAYLAFSANKRQQTYVKFKETCNEALDLAREDLQEHREWQGVFAEFLANIGLAILMLGVGYVGYGLYNKFENNDRFMFFRLKTSSIENLNGVKSALDEVNYTEIPSF